MLKTSTNANRSMAMTEANSITTSAAIGRLVFFGCMTLALVGLGTVNPLVTAAGMLVPILLWHFLWRPGHPAVLMFAGGFQWLQAFTPVLSADLEGKTLFSIFGGPELELAAFYSLASVLSLSAGIWVVNKYAGKPLPASVLRSQSSQLNVQRLFIAYILGSILAAAITFVAYRSGNLFQPILAFASIKWIPIFLLAWTTLQHRRNSHYLMIVIAVEVVIGLTGYFSTFKSILFMMIVIGLGTTIDERRVRFGPVILYGALCIFLAAFWQTIKVDYRTYLNEGTGQQVVTVPVLDRITYLGRAASDVTPASMWQGSVDGLLRLGYIEFFAYSIHNVPSRIPHQEGTLWLDAIQHTLMPRFLFPNKPVVNISERTNRFTLRNVAGTKQGTSISIGYPGESYIDFGPIAMHFPIFLLGCFFSWIYESFSRRGPYHLMGVALATSLLVFTAHQLEMTNVNLIGGLTTGTLAFYILHRWGTPRIWPWLCTTGYYRVR